MLLLSLRVNVHRALLARDRPVNTRSVLRRATCAHTVCAGASKKQRGEYAASVTKLPILRMAWG
jgi:hypothetical protein